MTLNDLALNLMIESSESTDDTDKLNVVLGWINDAISEIASLSEWKFFTKEYPLNTIQGVATYVLPAEALDLKYIRIPADDLEIEYIDPQRLVVAGYDIEQQSRPDYWWYQDANIATDDAPLTIKLSPVPDAIYALEAPYFFHPSTLTGTDKLPVPRDKVLVIKNRVRAYQKMMEKEYEAFDRQYQIFQSSLQAALLSDRKKHARSLTLQPRDIPSSSHRKFARLDPNHYRN